MFFGDQVPQVADLGLADAVDAPEALLQPVRVPGQVVIDHQMRALEVDAFAGGIVGDHHQHAFIVHEGLDRLAAILATDATMDFDDSLMAAEPGADFVGEIGERVARLGEDDQLAPIAGGIGHQRVIEHRVSSSVHLRSWPERRSSRACASSRCKVTISASSSAIVRAAVA